MLMTVSSTCRVWMDEVERKGVVHVKHGSCLRLQVVASGEIAKHNTSHSYALSHTGLALCLLALHLHRIYLRYKHALPYTHAFVLINSSFSGAGMKSLFLSSSAPCSHCGSRESVCGRLVHKRP